MILDRLAHQINEERTKYLSHFSMNQQKTGNESIFSDHNYPAALDIMENQLTLSLH